MCLALAAVPASGCSDRSAADAPASPTATATVPAASAVVSPTGSASTGSPTPTQRPAISGPDDHDGERALSYLKALADGVGPRVAGSAAEQQAAGYVAGQLRADGYDVELMRFDYTGDRFRAGSVVIGSTTYEALALDGSSGGSVSGEAIFVGLADAAGIGGRSLNAKIAVADRGATTFAEKYDTVKAFGAAGLVILNNTAGQVNGRARQGGSIPVLSISGEDATAVREAAQAGQRFAITAPGSTTTTATNVIARPKAGAECRLLVAGHFDTVAAAPGANDNASGVANVLELARAEAVGGPKDGLCFAAWSGEESGLFGSAAFVERAKATNTLPGLYLNLDVTGIGKGIEIIGDSEAAARALQIAGQEGVTAQRIQLPANTGSDHLSFEAAGVPVVYLSSGEFDTIHSPLDVSRDIDAAELDRIGDLALALIRDRLPQVARGQGHS